MTSSRFHRTPHFHFHTHTHTHTHNCTLVMLMTHSYFGNNLNTLISCFYRHIRFKLEGTPSTTLSRQKLQVWIFGVSVTRLLTRARLTRNLITQKCIVGVKVYLNCTIKDVSYAVNLQIQLIVHSLSGTAWQYSIISIAISHSSIFFSLED